MFWVISVYFNLRNILPKFGTFLLGHPVYVTSSSMLMTSQSRNKNLGGGGPVRLAGNKGAVDSTTKLLRAKVAYLHETDTYQIRALYIASQNQHPYFKVCRHQIRNESTLFPLDGTDEQRYVGYANVNVKMVLVKLLSVCHTRWFYYWFMGFLYLFV